jgi:hypothetical protein
VTHASAPRRVDGLVGTVVAGPFGTGSKSERQGIWLDTAEGRLALRRLHGPSHGDEALARLVGQRVSCDGFITDHLLLADAIRPIG